MCFVLRFIQYIKTVFLNIFLKVVSGMNYCVVVAVGSSSKCPKSPDNVDATLDECPVEKKEVLYINRTSVFVFNTV